MANVKFVKGDYMNLLINQWSKVYPDGTVIFATKKNPKKNFFVLCDGEAWVAKLLRPNFFVRKYVIHKRTKKLKAEMNNTIKEELNGE